MSGRAPWRTALPVAALIAGGSLLSACGSSGPAGPAADTLLVLPVPQRVTVATRTIAALGTVLVDGRGRTVYMFPPDAGSRVRCTGACAGTWPPLVIAPGRRPTAGAGVTAARLGTVADPNTGARVVTYGGYPLYRYAGDVRAGQAAGQGLFSDGGPWYALDPDGTPITVDPGAAG